MIVGVGGGGRYQRSLELAVDGGGRIWPKLATTDGLVGVTTKALVVMRASALLVKHGIKYQ